MFFVFLHIFFFFSSRRRHTRWPRDWSSDVCSSDSHLGPPSRTALAERVLAGSPSPVAIRFAELGERALVSGAIAHLRNAPWIFLPEEDDARQPEGAAAEAAPPGTTREPDSAPAVASDQALTPD